MAAIVNGPIEEGAGIAENLMRLRFWPLSTIARMTPFTMVGVMSAMGSGFRRFAAHLRFDDFAGAGLRQAPPAIEFEDGEKVAACLAFSAAICGRFRRASSIGGVDTLPDQGSQPGLLMGRGRGSLWDSALRGGGRVFPAWKPLNKIEMTSVLPRKPNPSPSDNFAARPDRLFNVPIGESFLRHGLCSLSCPGIPQGTDSVVLGCCLVSFTH